MSCRSKVFIAKATLRCNSGTLIKWLHIKWRSVTHRFLSIVESLVVLFQIADPIEDFVALVAPKLSIMLLFLIRVILCFQFAIRNWGS